MGPDFSTKFVLIRTTKSVARQATEISPYYLPEVSLYSILMSYKSQSPTTFLYTNFFKCLFCHRCECFFDSKVEDYTIRHYWFLVCSYNSTGHNVSSLFWENQIFRCLHYSVRKSQLITKLTKVVLFKRLFAATYWWLNVNIEPVKCEKICFYIQTDL